MAVTEGLFTLILTYYSDVPEENKIKLDNMTEEEKNIARGYVTSLRDDDAELFDLPSFASIIGQPDNVLAGLVIFRSSILPQFIRLISITERELYFTITSHVLLEKFIIVDCLPNHAVEAKCYYDLIDSEYALSD